jgi:acetyltransferase
MVREIVVTSEEEALNASGEIGFPLVMKAVGPVHKTDVGGVVLNVRNEESVRKEFNTLMKIEGSVAVLLAQMAFGTELFLGAKYESPIGHVILCGLGGIYVEVMKDVTSGLAPLSKEEAYSMIHNLKSFNILKGYRGKSGVDIRKFAQIIVRLSTLLRFATEIKELDINPLIGNTTSILAVDARVRIEK